MSLLPDDAMLMSRDALEKLLHSVSSVTMSEEHLLRFVVEWAMRRENVRPCLPLEWLHELGPEARSAIRELLEPLLAQFDFRKLTRTQYRYVMDGLCAHDTKAGARWARALAVEQQETLTPENSALIIADFADTCLRSRSFRCKPRILN